MPTVPDTKNVPHHWALVAGARKISSIPSTYTFLLSPVVDVQPGHLATLTVQWRTAADVGIFGVAGFAQDVGTPVFVSGWQGCVPGTHGRCGNQYCGFGMDHCSHAKSPFIVPKFTFDPATELGRVSWCFANEATITRQAFFKLIATFEGIVGGVPSKTEDWDGPPLPETANAIGTGLSPSVLAGEGLRLQTSE